MIIECEEIYLEVGSIIDSMICALPKSGCLVRFYSIYQFQWINDPIFQDDQGGSLLCDDNTKHCGISSWGLSCSRNQDYPGVFTETYQYLDWIVNQK